MPGQACRICDAATVAAGRRFGTFSGSWYDLRQCPRCRYAFVATPRTDYDRLYSSDYYAGRGADPLVDYLFELEHPTATIRRYEWAGLVRAIAHLADISGTTRWLDFGCGHGGLVRFVRQRRPCHIVGFDEGWIVEPARALGIPILDRTALTAEAGFDIVTAIEVLEHVADPVAALREIRRLLRPGGLFFFTTGNARPWRSRLAQWPYIIPEIHISFFEPTTAALALRTAGFRPEQVGYLPGFTDIIRFKVLKNLRLRRPPAVERLVPWPVVAPLIDSRLEVLAHPVGWAV
jgi:SAM-dependent methyltransferase